MYTICGSYNGRDRSGEPLLPPERGPKLVPPTNVLPMPDLQSRRGSDGPMTRKTKRTPPPANHGRDSEQAKITGGGRRTDDDEIKLLVGDVIDIDQGRHATFPWVRE